MHFQQVANRYKKGDKQQQQRETQIIGMNERCKID